MSIYAALLDHGLRIADPERCALGMRGHHNPISITEDEFRFLVDYVSGRGCRSAYELGTGFGVSACAIGLGLVPTAGRLVSMDCYAEEVTNLAGAYPGRPDVYRCSDGFAKASELVSAFGLDDIVRLIVGRSPDDVPPGLFDFVFIDGRHLDDSLLADVGAVRERLADRSTVMLHDVGLFGPHALRTVSEWLGCEMQTADPPRTFGIGYFERR